MRKKAKKLRAFFIPSKENNYRAPFILSSFLLGTILVLFLLKLSFVCFLWNFPKTNLFADISKSVLVVLTNQTRQSSGISILIESSKLNQAAYLKAQDMLQNDYFAHTSPAGKAPWYWIESVGYNYQYAGENLAIDFLDSNEVFQAWLNSAGHRANIVNSNFKDIGMAVATGDFNGRETTVVVQFFATELNIPSASAKEPSATSGTSAQTKTSTAPKQSSVSVYSPISLSNYYAQKGQALPSIAQRGVLFESLGLGAASSYQGLSWQNALLVNKLLELDRAQSQSLQPSPTENLTTPTPISTPSPETTLTQTQVATPTTTTPATPKETEKPIFPAGEIELPKPPNETIGFKAFNFVAQRYDGITKNIFIIVFGMVFISLCIDVAAKSSFKHGNIIFRGTFYSFTLIGLFLLDKAVIIKMIPHSLTIL